MRSTWTDDRLDDFAAQTGRRFDQLERRMDDGFRRVDADIRELRADLNGRFDALNRAMLMFSGSLVISLFGLLATFVLTQI